MLMMGEDNYNDSSGFLPSGDPSADYKFNDFAAGGLCIDLDIFNSILEENPNHLQNNPEDPSLRNISPGESAPKSIQFQTELPSLGFTFGDLLRYNSEVPDDRAESLDGSFDYHGK